MVRSPAAEGPLPETKSECIVPTRARPKATRSIARGETYGSIPFRRGQGCYARDGALTYCWARRRDKGDATHICIRARGTRGRLGSCSRWGGRATGHKKAGGSPAGPGGNSLDLDYGTVRLGCHVHALFCPRLLS